MLCFTTILCFPADPTDTVTIEPRQDTYEVGDVIMCYGNGNPIASLLWSPSESPTWASGRMTEYKSALLTEQSMVGQTQHWFCTSRNIVDGVPHYAEDKITFNVGAFFFYSFFLRFPPSLNRFFFSNMNLGCISPYKFNSHAPPVRDC